MITKKLTIATKIILLSGGFILLMASSFLYIVLVEQKNAEFIDTQKELVAEQSRFVERQITAIDNDDKAVARLETVQRVGLKFTELRFWLSDLAASWQNEAEENAVKTKNELLASLTDLRVTDPQVADTVRKSAEVLFSSMITAVDAYTEGNRILGNSIAADAQDAASTVSETLVKLVADARGQAALASRQVRESATSVQDAGQNVSQAGEQVLAGNDHVLLVVVNVLVFTLVAGVGLSWLFMRSTLTPLRNLTKAMEDIAQGQGDLSRRLPVSGNDELSRLASGFNLFVEKIHRTVNHVQSAVSDLVAVASQVTDVTEHTRASVQQQQLETEQVSSSMTGMTQSTNNVEAHVSNAAESVSQAHHEADRGKQVVATSIESIHGLANVVERASDVIQRLDKDTDNIGGILDVIRDVADQTNLLALNAAIEAARAGDQGRGFAVVADEVRTLAHRTQESTQEIQSLIEGLQAAAKEAVNVMSEGREQGEISVQRAAQAGESLDIVASAIATINDLNANIVQEVKAQATTADEIDASLVNIKTVAAQTARDAQDTAASGEELSRVTTKLHKVCEQFKL